MASASDEDSESDDVIFVSSFKLPEIIQSVQGRSTYKPEKATAAGIVQSETTCIPPFCPEDKTQNVELWLSQIEEISTFLSWDEQTTLYNAVTGLRGSAVVWYQSLPSYNISWTEWKLRLKEAFSHVQHQRGN